jgi:flap endonuclease-1
MGVLLTPIITKQAASLDDLAGRRLAVDGNGELYQFLALIRLPDGTPLMGDDGRVTSHLVGLFYRTTRLIGEYGLDLTFVFDGRPPALKEAEIGRRRATRRRYEAEAAEARAAGDTSRAYSKSTMSSRLSREMVEEAVELLTLLGVPVVQAPGEGEAQAAFMARRGDVWAAASKDYDALLFGAPRLLRFLTLTGKEFLPSKGAFRPIVPELIDSAALFASLEITREQLIDVAILMGTDFNEGIPGIGPKKALKLVRTHGAIEHMSEEIRSRVPEFTDVRQIFREPAVSSDVERHAGPMDPEGVVRFLCGRRRFAETRVRAALERMQAGGDGAPLLRGTERPG